MSQSIILLKFKSDQIDPLYLAYFFKSYDFYCQKYKTAIGVTINNISIDALKGINVTIPPLHIQRSISKLLFQIEEIFANKTFGITKEINLRKAQFKYFLDIFTSFEHSLYLRDRPKSKFAQIYANFVKEALPEQEFHAYQPFPMVKIGDVCTFYGTNGNLNKNYFAKSGLPYIQYGQIHKGELITVANNSITYIEPIHCANVKKAQANDVIITDVSEDIENIGKAIAWIGDIDVVTSQHCLIARPNKQLLDGMYLAYYLKSSNFSVQKRRIAYGSAIYCIYAKDIAKCTMPLPPLEVQQAIANFLFNLEQLISDSSQGLAHEQQLRQTQLTFMIDHLFS